MPGANAAPVKHCRAREERLECDSTHMLQKLEIFSLEKSVCHGVSGSLEGKGKQMSLPQNWGRSCRFMSKESD